MYSDLQNARERAIPASMRCSSASKVSPAQTAVIVEHAELYHALDSIAGTLENRVRNRLGELLGSASAV
jgi:hypothetical protein